jgi:hypothetical protein
MVRGGDRLKRHLASVERARGVLMVLTGVGRISDRQHIEHQHLAA